MYFSFKNFVSLVGLYLDMFHDNCLVVVLFVSVFVLICVLGSFFFSGGFLFFLGVGEQLMEFWWTMFPGMILFSLVAPSLYGLYYLDVGGESLSSGLVVVIAKQWYWIFNVLFCEVCNILDFCSLNQLFQVSSYYDFLLFDGFRHLEVDVPLLLMVGQVFRFLFSSSDVVHSYCVPELAVKVDCVPGRYNQGFMFFNVPGKYYGSCVEICGVGHSMMPVCMEGLV